MTARSQSIFQRLPIGAATVATVLLAIRAAIGPWGFVNSPFITETVFWLALIWLLCSRLGREESAPAQASVPKEVLAISLIAVAAAFLHNLADPFLSDDYIIARGPHFTLSAFLAALHTPGGDGSFRPLSTVYYQILLSCGKPISFWWHLAGLSVHLLNAALVFAIAWRLWRDRMAAAVSSLVFGLHGTRPEATLWTAANCDLLACACALGALYLGLRGKALLPLSLLLAAAAILFKESAYALPLIALGVIPRPRVFAAATGAVCAALLAWRWHLFHGPGGYVDPTTGRPAILSLRPLPVLKAVFLRLWDQLLVPVNWDAPRTWWLPLAIVAALLGVLALAVCARTGRTQFLLIGATCCAVLPAIHLALVGQSGMGSRIYYLPAVPFALLLGSLARGQATRELRISMVMVLGMAGILEHNLATWHANALNARSLCEHPRADTPTTNDGVVLFQNGYAECVADAEASSKQ